MSQRADVVMVGGGVVGGSAAWQLRQDGFTGRIVVLERDPTYQHASSFLAMVNRVPDLHDVTGVYGWAGLDEMTPDHNPVLGPHPDLSGFIFANGFSGHGLMMSPATGKIVSGSVRLGRSETFDVRIFAPDRFARGALIHDAATS